MLCVKCKQIQSDQSPPSLALTDYQVHLEYLFQLIGFDLSGP